MKIAWVYLDKRGAAVEALKDYDAMACIIANHSEANEEAVARKASIRSGPVKVTSNSRNPHGGETRLAATLDEIDVLKERYRRALEYMEWFQPAWDALTEDEQFVLKEFYQFGEETRTDAITAICAQFEIERSSAYKRKNRALARLSTLLYGK